MFQPNNQLSAHTNSLAMQEPQTLMQVDPNGSSIVVREDSMQNVSQAESIIYYSKQLQDDLRMIGVEIKKHEDNMKSLKSQKNKLEDSIIDLQVMLGKFNCSSTPNTEDGDHYYLQSKEAITGQILQHEKSAAGILCQLKTRHGTQASHLPFTKDVVGVVATLGKVDDDNLSRLLSEYLGEETMLAIVCKTYEGVKALEMYDNEGCIYKSCGLHGLGASIGRALEGRFLVVCLENLRPYAGDFVSNDSQRRLDILKPRLANGESPPGFLGFAVNMINVDIANLFCVTAGGHGIRETLFYNLFSRLQVYRTRVDMLHALPCISNGALSLDGGMIRSPGVFFLGHRQQVNVRFPKLSEAPSVSESSIGVEKQIKEMTLKKENMQQDLKREQALLDKAKLDFDRKKAVFLKFLAESSSYASRQQAQGAQSRLTPG